MNLRTQKSCWQQDISRYEKGIMVLKASAVTGITAWLYFRSAWAVPALIPVWLWYYRRLEKECIKKKQQEFLLQFKEMLQAMSAALNTGYSVENAVKESQKELKLIYSEQEPISRELLMLVRELRMQIPVEQALKKMASRSGLEDVESFADVFVTAKRSGGDMIAIIKNTAGQIADKIDVRREIQTILAAKQYEFKVMSAVPYGIIAYMTLSFPEFMTCLYGNIIGAGVMAVCLSVYIGAYYLGVRLIEIEV